MTRVAITDADDPRLAAYRDVRDKDARRQGTFVAEGIVVLDALLNGGRHPLESVLVSNRRLESVADTLNRIPDNVPIYEVEHQVVLELVGFNIHRGLLAVGRRAPQPALEALCARLSADATVLVLEDLTDVDNVGACFRNAAAFGAEAVLLTARCGDPLYRKAIRVSAGHSVRLPFHRGGDAAQLIPALRASGVHSAALCLDPDAAPLRSWERPVGRLALWLGTEGVGLSHAARDGADTKLRIEMAAGVDSLNVSVAGAVALHATHR